MPTINLFYQGRNKPDPRNKPRSLAFGIHTPSFLRKKAGDGKRQWWSDGTTLITRVTQFEVDGEALATFGKKTDLNPLDSMPFSTRKSSTRVLSEHHSSARRPAAPSSAIASFSQLSSGARSLRNSGGLPLSILSSSSRDRSPPRGAERAQFHEIESDDIPFIV